MPKATKLKKYEEVLMAALKFTEDDLAANASGSFSAAQVLMLKRRRATQAVSIGVMCGIVAMFLLFVVVIVPNSAIPMLSFSLLFSLLALLIGGVAMLQVTRDLRAGLQMVEGRIDLDTTPGQNNATYTVKVEGKKFKVKKRAFLAFKNGDPYRIYYTPHTKTILSADWLRDDQPFVDQPNRDDAGLDDHWHNLTENDHLHLDKG